MKLIKYIAIIISCLLMQTGVARQIWISVKTGDTPLDQVNVILYNDSTNDLLAKGKTETSGMAFITWSDTITENNFRIELNKEGFSDKIIHRQTADQIIAIEAELSKSSDPLSLYITGSIILICLALGILFKMYKTKKNSKLSR